MKIELSLNGVSRALDAQQGETLLSALRRAGLKGTKFGCGEGDCGACTVLLDGEPVNACLVLAGRVEGHEVTTIEGLGSVADPHPLQRIFAEEAAVQCGYCTPGMILSTHALLQRESDPDDQEILRSLDGNLCRCTGYVKNLAAVQRAARELRSDGDDD